MKKWTYNDMPMVTCPNCDTEFEWSDYYDIAQGDDNECPKCEASLEILDVDYSISCRIGIKAADIKAQQEQQP